MSKTKMRVLWFAVNTAWWGLAAAEIFGGHEWAGNVFAFVTIVLLALTLFYALLGTLLGVLGGKDTLADIPDRKIPASWSWAYDAAGMLMLASVGWFWLAAAVFVQACAQHWTWIVLQSAKRAVTSEDALDDLRDRIDGLARPTPDQP